MTSELTCSCCGTATGPIITCCSGLGAASFGYCRLCHTHNAEPEGIVAWVGFEVGDNAALHVTQTTVHIDGQYVFYFDYIRSERGRAAIERVRQDFARLDAEEDAYRQSEASLHAPI